MRPLPGRRLLARLGTATLAVLGVAGAGDRSVGRESAAGPAATESEWIVREIVLDLAEMIEYGKSREPFEASSLSVRSLSSGERTRPQFEVRMRGGPSRALVRHVLAPAVLLWAPDAYAPFAQSLLDRVQLEPVAQVAPPEVPPLARLVDLLAATIELENQRLSRRLEEAPLDAAAHEQAALLLGAFGLREAAGVFSDTRPVLCRMTAHLALSRTLRRNTAASVEGIYAEILLVTLAGRQKDALERLEARKPLATPAEQPWIRALSMRNTHDYRLSPDPRGASLLERLELFRALSQSLGGPRALEALEAAPPEPVADWSRVALESDIAVETGNVLVPPALALEMAELEQTWRVSRGGALPEGEPLAALAGRPARCIERRPDAPPRPGVLHWGTWAAYFQRHIAHVLTETDSFYGSTLGHREAAGSFRAGATEKLAGLALFPFVVHRWENRLWIERSDAGSRMTPLSESDEKACDDVVPILREEPESVSARLWDSLTRTCGRQRESGDLPEYARWFSSRLPWGTAYDAINRARAVPTFRHYDASRIEALLALRPYEASLVEMLLKRMFHDTPTQEQFEKAAGALLDYDRSLIRRKLGLIQDKPAEYQPLAQRLCDQDADECLSLGAYLADRGLDETATVKAYQRAVDVGRNRVAVANQCFWLVDHYFDHGRREKAREIAAMAAATYSGGGLFLQGRIFERLGQYEAAEQLYQKIADRYEVLRNAQSFYIRREIRAPHSTYREKANAAVRELFPGGLRRVFAADLLPRASLLSTAPPLAGVGLGAREVTEPMRRLGLRVGDLIVGVDGYRVENWDQLVCVRSFRDAQDIAFLVRRGWQYLEIKGAYPRIRYGP